MKISAETKSSPFSSPLETDHHSPFIWLTMVNGELNRIKWFTINYWNSRVHHLKARVHQTKSLYYH